MPMGTSIHVQPPMAWGALSASGSMSQCRLCCRMAAIGLHITAFRAASLSITSMAYRIGEP
jgi:hypothetical protein